MIATPLPISSAETGLIQGVNLIPEGRRQTRRQRQRLRNWSLVCGVYLLVLIGAWAAAGYVWSGQDADLRGKLDKIEAKIKRDRTRAARLRPHLADASVSLAANRRLAHQPDWSLLLGLIADRLGDQAVLASCQLTPRPASPMRSPKPAAAKNAVPSEHQRRSGGYLLQLTGFGRSHAAVFAYVRRLEKTTLFGEVKLLDADQKPFKAGQAIAFRIRCTLTRLTQQE